MNFKTVLKILRANGWRTLTRFRSPGGEVVMLTRRSISISVELICGKIFLYGKPISKKLLKTYF